ncbi:MAG: DUF401 family protein [Proteobacteria bacterium]|nr:DUF401 family protein [Pseudomonadota bacterium]MBU4470540.1 DUF401 family protein [Pseudomonadota bacterium]MCG2751376.1 DUF401 family protein [Desulfobacteraceae bacterium]
MIALLDHIPAILRMAIVFVLVLYAIRKNLSLGNAFMLGALFMSLLFAMPVAVTVKTVFLAIVYPKTLSLAVVVSLILVLSSSMEVTGRMQRMLSGFRGLVKSPKLNLIIFPAMIGLLPMPGGAVFSAPMVKEMAVDSGLTSDRLSFINYWFRHIWEYWWPMYPGVLLATFMADINLAVFVVMMFPLTLSAVYLGGFSIKGIQPVEMSGGKRPPLKPFLLALIPILIVIVLGLSLGLLLSHFFPKMDISKEAGLIISLCIAISWIWLEDNLPVSKRKAIVFNKKLLNMIYMIIAILVFKEILEAGGAVEHISRELVFLKIPLVLIAAILPFIVGLFTGITIAFVGSTFPILITLIHAQGETAYMPAYIMAGLVSGFSGVLLSPLHLCLLLSNEYFETSLKHVYHHLWIPCAGLLVAALGYFQVLHWIYS